MDNLKHIRAQGRDAKRLNDEENHNITEHNCPYGPGENRDAWMEGFGGKEETVEQVDTSKPTTQDVRTDAPSKTVRKGKAKTGKAKGSETAVRTETTGTGETALKTTTEAAKPAEAGEPNVSTTLGDPAATDGDPTAAGIDSPVAPQGDAAAKLARDLM